MNKCAGADVLTAAGTSKIILGHFSRFGLPAAISPDCPGSCCLPACPTSRTVRSCLPPCCRSPCSRRFCSIMNTWKNIFVVFVAVNRSLDHHVLRALNFGRRRMPKSSGLRTIESISYVFLRFLLSSTLQSPKPWGPYPCWPACILVRFDLNQGTFRLAGPRGHTSVRIQWPRWLPARWRPLLDWWFSFQSREAFLCFPCHTCKRHSNKLLCGGACRHGGASYRRLGACAVTDFADALHGTSARNAALHGCLKGVGLARQCLPFSCSMPSSFCCVPARRRGFSSASSRLSSASHCRSFSSRRLK